MQREVAAGSGQGGILGTKGADRRAEKRNWTRETALYQVTGDNVGAVVLARTEGKRQQ